MLASEAFAKTEHGSDGRFVSNGSGDGPSLSALNREHRKIQAEVDALRTKAEAIVRRGGTATKSPMKHPVHAKLKAAEAHLQASKDAMKAHSRATTASEALAKVKDAEGHEHGADGKFTSGSGSGKAEDIVKPSEKPRKFESETCTRCHGSGKYSFNQRDGNMCLGCKGKGERHTKRGAAAAKFYLDSLKTKAKDLKPGDVVHQAGGPDGSKGGLRTVASVSEPHVISRSGKWDAAKGDTVWHDNIGVTVKFTNGQTSSGPLEGEFRQQFPPEIMAEKRKAALDYMDTLTAQGTPKKSIKKVKDAEGHEHGSDGKFTSGGGEKKKWKGSGKGLWANQEKRDAKIKAMTEAGKITPADPGSHCHECGGYPDILDGLRPHPKAKYKVDGQNVCGTHVLRVAEGRDAYWNDKTGRYQGTKVDNHMVIGPDGAIGIVSGKKRKAPGVSASKAEKDAAKKAERLAREKAANDKKLAKPCKRSQPMPEHMRAAFKPDTDFSGRGPRGKFMCVQHMFLDGDHSPHDIDFENDDDTRCRIAARYDKEHA